MTVENKEAETEEVEAPPKRRGLDELPHLELAPMTYVFQVDSDETLADIEALELPVYFILATNKRAKEPDYTTLMKVVNTDTAKTISVVDNDLGMAKVSEEAWFRLPQLPYKMLIELDNFFRAVEKELHSEAIVILTYDHSKEGEEGWGFLVPAQENTAAACKYDHESIIADRPEGVEIVGSVHSHPGMAAYASGTDHKDQANFDGLHITYGWQTSVNGGATQFHAELQINGSTYHLDTDDIFAPKPISDEDDETLKTHLAKVKKATTTPGYHGGKFQGSGAKTTQTTSSSSHSAGGGTDSSVTGVLSKYYNELGKLLEKADPKAPKPWEAIYVVEIFSDESHCPVCNEVLLASCDIEARRCLACKIFLAMPEETLEDIILIRMEEGIDTTALEEGHPSNKKSQVTIWRRASSGDNHVEVISLANDKDTATESPTAKK